MHITCVEGDKSSNAAITAIKRPAGSCRMFAALVDMSGILRRHGDRHVCYVRTASLSSLCVLHRLFRLSPRLCCSFVAGGVVAVQCGDGVPYTADTVNTPCAWKASSDSAASMVDCKS